MELATTLKGQTVRNAVREVGINPNYWYPVAWADKLKAGTILPTMVWQQAIALYRDSEGQAHAIEDACPHKGVVLHKGQLQGDNIVCPYHGWEFNTNGECVNIPYLPKEQKLPCAQARSYPTREKYGVIWVFPGDAALADITPFPEVPEYDDDNWMMVPITGHFKAHFSICNENTMDVFHGFLHNNLQGWFDPVLLSLRETDGTVRAQYRVRYQGWISKVLGLSSEEDGITTRTVTVHYKYPHYHSTLEGVSSLHLMRLPVSPTETRSFSLLFLQLPLPKWLRDTFKPLVIPFIRRFVFMRFLNQDVEMMESEQKTYEAGRDRRYVEINPAIIALQRLVVRQYEQFVQQSSQLQGHRNGDSQRTVAFSKAGVGQVEQASESSVG
ncbi:aromatic ring-hydroxylating dioxygenase subunit alpha [Oscillatoria sp. FACHB-1407]|uniref:aromatic ring-hydroxylating dioxygenase subunit alpha n=1 Tax=Oscillatoria sp. FACHB-1407 TaxID=2692847 RepID=UPI001681F2A7|nr:aromatic ring-hydroxylating dioxygenase subunit alpha [Oscillatoria sp. FACHB-1407]MBD2462335.1 aromatic ring-hydroxylating dioxygenase subunit alpha [Oscillatoria sp. FACHB-1407]